MTSGHPGDRHRAGPPGTVDRLVVHQMDVVNPVPGGIDGALRGILRFAGADDTTAVVGVLADRTDVEAGLRACGTWERHEIDGRTTWFLPVARLDASDQKRRIPHSIRLMLGLMRYRSRLPRARTLHAHRADTAWASRLLVRRTPLVYFVHTQANGLSSGATDSFWRRAPWLHRRMERSVVRSARSVIVFNPDYADDLSRQNPRTMFSPSWYEPDLVHYTRTPEHPHRIVWLGRLEAPKDPLLALDVIQSLVDSDRATPWTLSVLGSGTLLEPLRARLETLPEAVRERVTIHGAVDPATVGQLLGSSGAFLMTSQPGYEGHPRVLIEALAAGLPSVVTEGSDTGGLVVDGHSGFVCTRDPGHLAAALRATTTLDRDLVRMHVDQLSGPSAVRHILEKIERDVA